MSDHVPSPTGRSLAYYPVTHQIAPTDVNIADLITIRDKMESKYVARLPNGFYDPISSPFKTMSSVKKQIKGNKVSSMSMVVSEKATNQG